jgi:hypothetical protein
MLKLELELRGEVDHSTTLQQLRTQFKCWQINKMQTMLMEKERLFQGVLTNKS